MIRLAILLALTIFGAIPVHAGTLPAVAVYGANTSENLHAAFTGLTSQHGAAVSGVPNADPTKPFTTLTWQWYDDHPVWKSVWIQTVTLNRPMGENVVVGQTRGFDYELYQNAFPDPTGEFVAGTFQHSNADYHTEAFIWDEASGYQSLKSVLLERGIGDPSLVSALQFLSVGGMTADGRYLFGSVYGHEVLGYAESSYLIDLGPASSAVPEPSAILSWTLIATAGVFIRRRITA